MEKKQQSCSVCLEQVTDIGERSIAKLKCGHHFHLDCIGSAFNAKGSMQCPNCRHVEDGRWLYANGGRPHDEWGFDEFAASYEDDYEVYAGYADMLHPHHELFGHFQWCPYQASYPQFSVTLEEMDPPAANPYPDVIVNVLYGDHSAPANQQQQQQQQYCPYLRRLEDQLGVMDIPNGGNSRGPQSYTVPERSGWASQSTTSHATSVGMMNDVGLSSIPNDRFRWSVRSDVPQPGYNGVPSRNSENSTGTSWQPCPQHGLGGSSHYHQNHHQAQHHQPANHHHQHSNPPRFGQSRRSRHRNHSNSNSNIHRTAAPAAAVRGAPVWPSTPPVLETTGVQNGGIPFMWQQQGNQNYQWRRWGGYELEWRPWFQTTSSSSSSSSLGGLESSTGTGTGYHHHQHHHHHHSDGSSQAGISSRIIPPVPPEYAAPDVVSSGMQQEYLLPEGGIHPRMATDYVFIDAPEAPPANLRPPYMR